MDPYQFLDHLWDTLPDLGLLHAKAERILQLAKAVQVKQQTLYHHQMGRIPKVVDLSMWIVVDWNCLGMPNELELIPIPYLNYRYKNKSSRET